MPLAQYWTHRRLLELGRLLDAVLLVPVDEPLLRSGEVACDALEQCADEGECLIGLEVLPLLLVTELAIMLDVLASRLKLGNSERRGGTLEEVSELGELLQVFTITVSDK
jgi:hypothetical protein